MLVWASHKTLLTGGAYSTPQTIQLVSGGRIVAGGDGGRSGQREKGGAGEVREK